MQRCMHLMRSEVTAQNVRAGVPEDILRERQQRFAPALPEQTLRVIGLPVKQRSANPPSMRSPWESWKPSTC